MAFQPAEFETMMRSLVTLDIDQLGLLNQEIVRQMKIDRRVKGAEIAKNLKVGDKIRLPANCKPKYLARQTAVVKDIKDTRAHVLLDRGPMGKFRNGIVVVPFSLLELI